MKIVLLMAGKATRFKNTKYAQWQKPLIPVGHQCVVDWTLSSLDESEIDYNELYIVYHSSGAKEIEQHFLKKGVPKSNMLCLDFYTQGNLATAYIACSHFKFNDFNSILILDCDNLYNGKNLLAKFREAYLLQLKVDAYVCHFQPKDDSQKWCFISFDAKNNRVTKVSEKNNSIQGYPLIGTFWFSSIRLFKQYANKVILNKNASTEVFTSDAIKSLVNDGRTVITIEVDDVVPLGTPEDIDHANLY